ncbi:hypothetical protein DAI22_11g129800 [Oryza sativa Japonica Group]|nr:hypothetical protein DAI22_11g129800 [Oryza sativa Japonica Group]
MSYILSMYFLCSRCECLGCRLAGSSPVILYMCSNTAEPQTVCSHNMSLAS